MDETGNVKGTLTVSVYVFETGEYQIRLVDRPDITTKWTREDFEQRPGGCEDPPPMTATSTGEDSVFAGPTNVPGPTSRARSIRRSLTYSRAH
ncbi:MAG: hypothetical protein IPG67_06075 [Acidobacteria bacterium]|nr:hypothetical protein [Acidobacteriota bacterium]